MIHVCFLALSLMFKEKDSLPAPRQFGFLLFLWSALNSSSAELNSQWKCGKCLVLNSSSPIPADRTVSFGSCRYFPQKKKSVGVVWLCDPFFNKNQTTTVWYLYAVDTGERTEECELAADNIYKGKNNILSSRLQVQQSPQAWFAGDSFIFCRQPSKEFSPSLV